MEEDKTYNLRSRAPGQTQVPLRNRANDNIKPATRLVRSRQHRRMATTEDSSADLEKLALQDRQDKAQTTAPARRPASTRQLDSSGCGPSKKIAARGVGNIPTSGKRSHPTSRVGSSFKENVAGTTTGRQPSKSGTVPGPAGKVEMVTNLGFRSGTQTTAQGEVGSHTCEMRLKINASHSANADLPPETGATDGRAPVLVQPLITLEGHQQGQASTNNSTGGLASQSISGPCAIRELQAVEPTAKASHADPSTPPHTTPGMAATGNIVAQPSPRTPATTSGGITALPLQRISANLPGGASPELVLRFPAVMSSPLPLHCRSLQSMLHGSCQPPVPTGSRPDAELALSPGNSPRPQSRIGSTLKRFGREGVVTSTIKAPAPVASRLSQDPATLAGLCAAYKRTHVSPALEICTDEGPGQQSDISGTVEPKRRSGSSTSCMQHDTAEGLILSTPGIGSSVDRAHDGDGPANNSSPVEAVSLAEGSMSITLRPSPLSMKTPVAVEVLCTAEPMEAQENKDQGDASLLGGTPTGPTPLPNQQPKDDNNESPIHAFIDDTDTDVFYTPVGWVSGGCRFSSARKPTFSDTVRTEAFFTPADLPSTLRSSVTAMTTPVAVDEGMLSFSFAINQCTQDTPPGPGQTK